MMSLDKSWGYKSVGFYDDTEIGRLNKEREVLDEKRNKDIAKENLKQSIACALAVIISLGIICFVVFFIDWLDRWMKTF